MVAYPPQWLAHLPHLLCLHGQSSAPPSSLTSARTSAKGSDSVTQKRTQLLSWYCTDTAPMLYRCPLPLPLLRKDNSDTEENTVPVLLLYC